MEKYYKASDIGALIEKLLKKPYYQHEGESWYSGVSAVWDELIGLPAEEVDIDEFKKEVADLRNRLHLIWAIGVDYDGCNTVESLKELIDELVSCKSWIIELTFISSSLFLVISQISIAGCLSFSNKGIPFWSRYELTLIDFLVNGFSCNSVLVLHISS